MTDNSEASMASYEPEVTSTEHDVAGDSDIQEFLHRFAWALTSGDGRAAATLWALPSLMIGDTMVQAIMDRDELERMFRNARDHYNAAGIKDTRGEIRKVDWISNRVVMVHVRWPHLDASGQERGEEHSSYLLRRDDHGDLKLHVAITHGDR
jgi:hypothetical protein